MLFVGLFFLAYLLGSFPTALIVGRLARGIDIRDHGSGNMGATNVFRILGGRWGVLVTLIDLTKGLLPTLLFAHWWGMEVGFDPLYQQIAYGIAAVSGHIFTVFARFRGGKGVLTGLGVLVALLPLEASIAVGIFVITFALARVVSLGSILAAFGLCIVIVAERFMLEWAVRFELVLTCVLLLIVVLITHRSNIRRLLAGTEPRFGNPRKKSPAAAPNSDR